ncbi:uncharacterized protein [Clytia hemisphaerica]
MKALRKKLFGAKWLKSMNYYVRNRHTGTLENYHNLKLVYTPKRIGYKNESYISRGQLTVLDHNRHLNRPQLKRKDGTPVFSSSFGKRSKQWYVVPVPVPKTYSYIPEMIAKTMWRRHLKPNLKLKPRTETCMLAKNIASKPRPSTEVLIERHTARAKLQFDVKQSTTVDVPPPQVGQSFADELSESDEEENRNGEDSENSETD